MTTATQEKGTTVTTGAATNDAATAAPTGKIKPEITEQATRLRAAMVLDKTTNTIPAANAAIEAELKTFGQSRESLTTLAKNLHNLSASHTLASGNVAHDHWATQKPEERGPVIAPLSFWEGQSITATHTPVSVERVAGKDETATVHGQVNIHQHTTFARNTGAMSSVRQQLRANAAATFNKS